MRDFFIRVIINAIAIAITAMVIPNIHVANNDIGTLLIIGLVFGIVNSLIKTHLDVAHLPGSDPDAGFVCTRD